MKYLAIDYGLKRVGIAVSDKFSSFVFPRRTLVRETKKAFFTELIEIIKEEDVDEIVIGLPLLENGEDCLTTTQVRHFAESLKHRVSLPIYWMNEFLSSHEAEYELYAMGKNIAETKKILDAHSAVLILESFLNLPENRRQRA